MDLNYNVNISLADVFQRSLQIQQAIQQSTFAAMGSNMAAYGAMVNQFGGFTPNMFQYQYTPSAFRGMFPPALYNPPAYLYQPWGNTGLLAQQGYFGAPNTAAILARQYNALPAWPVATAELLAGTAAETVPTWLLSKIVGGEFFGEGFLKKVSEKGLTKALQEAPMWHLGFMGKWGGGIGRAIGKRVFGEGLAMTSALEMGGTLAGMVGAYEAASALYYPFTKLGTEFMHGMSMEAHMYNQAARIGQMFIRPEMFGGRGTTMDETRRLAHELTRQRIELQGQFPWVKEEALGALHESAIGIVAANPMTPFWSVTHKDVTKSFADAVKDVTNQLIKLGQTTLATTQQLGSAMTGLAQVGLTGPIASKYVTNADIIGNATGQGFMSVMQQSVAAANRFVGTGINTALGATLAQTSIQGTYGAIRAGVLGQQELVQLGGSAQSAAQTVTVGMQNFVMSQMGQILLSGMFDRTGMLRPGATGAVAMGLVGATAGTWGSSPQAYLQWLIMRGKMMGQLSGPQVNTSMLSLLRRLAGSNDTYALAGAALQLGFASSPDQALAMVSAAQNQIQESAYESAMQVQRMAIAKQYAIAKEFKIGAIGAALLGINPAKGAAAEAAIYKVFETPKEMVNYAGAAVTNYVQGVEADVVRWLRTATGRPAELGLLPIPQNYSNPLYHTAYVGGQKIEVMSNEDKEYARKHGITREEAINKAILSGTANYKAVSSLAERDSGYYWLNKNWSFKIGGVYVTDYSRAVWEIFSDTYKSATMGIGSPELVQESENKINAILGHSLPRNVSETEKILQQSWGAAALANLQKAGYAISKTNAGKNEKYLEEARDQYNSLTRILGTKAYQERVRTKIASEYLENVGTISKTYHAFGARDLNAGISSAASALSSGESIFKIIGTLYGGSAGADRGMQVFSNIANIRDAKQREAAIERIENYITSLSTEEIQDYLRKNLNMSSVEATSLATFIHQNPQELRNLINIGVGYSIANPQPSSPSSGNAASGGSTSLSGTPDLKQSVENLNKVLPQVVDGFKQVGEALQKGAS